jgi:Uma2 family endonuclease
VLSFSGDTLAIADRIPSMGGIMTAEPLPAWAYPPPGGFTADDLDRIPDLPPHTELIDGSLVFVSPRKYFHMLAISLLETSLRAQVPKGMVSCREMTIVVNRHNRPEPDVLVVHESAVSEDANETGFQAADTVLAIEVVSPESVSRDNHRKPQLYAEAGVPHFWRVEQGKGRHPVVYAFELERTTSTYVPVGIFHDRVKLAAPFTIDIDLTEIDHL